jgi:hypothetical protein
VTHPLTSSTGRSIAIIGYASSIASVASQVTVNLDGTLTDLLPMLFTGNDDSCNQTIFQATGLHDQEHNITIAISSDDPAQLGVVEFK